MSPTVQAAKTAEILAKTAMRLRNADAAEWHHALADWLETEADDAEHCRGELCPEFECGCEPIDFQGLGDVPAHHHCRFCNDDAPSLALAAAYLWSDAHA